MHASHANLASILVALSALCAQISAFHVESGTSCTTVGAACSYISDDSTAHGNATTTVNGFCAPDLTCASNGAKCNSDDQCFNYCGNGTCGGAGALCNSQDPFALNQQTITCAQGFKCSTHGETGSCEKPKAQVAFTTNNTMNAKAAAAVNPDSLATPCDDAPVTNGSALSNAKRHKRRLPEVQARQVQAADLRLKAA